jgi:hypothetical protein
MAIRLPPKTGSSILELPDDRHGRWFDRGGVRARG